MENDEKVIVMDAMCLFGGNKMNFLLIGSGKS